MRSLVVIREFFEFDSFRSSKRMLERASEFAVRVDDKHGNLSTLRFSAEGIGEVLPECSRRCEEFRQ